MDMWESIQEQAREAAAANTPAVGELDANDPLSHAIQGEKRRREEQEKSKHQRDAEDARKVQCIAEDWAAAMETRITPIPRFGEDCFRELKEIIVADRLKVDPPMPKLVPFKRTTTRFPAQKADKEPPSHLPVLPGEKEKEKDEQEAAKKEEKVQQEEEEEEDEVQQRCRTVARGFYNDPLPHPYGGQPTRMMEAPPSPTVSVKKAYPKIFVDFSLTADEIPLGTCTFQKAHTWFACRAWYVLCKQDCEIAPLSLDEYGSLRHGQFKEERLDKEAAKIIAQFVTEWNARHPTFPIQAKWCAPVKVSPYTRHDDKSPPPPFGWWLQF